MVLSWYEQKAVCILLTLTDIQQTGQTGNGTQFQIVESVFSAGQRQNQGVLRCSLYKFRIIIPAGTCTVTAAHQEEVTDFSGFHSIYNLTCCLEHGTVSKSGSDGFAAVDAAALLGFRIAAQFQCLLNDWRKILLSVNVPDAGVGNSCRGKYAILIAFLRGHETVCSKENRCRNVCKFFLLILPCGAEVALEMGIFFQFRIAVRRKHFSGGIYLNACPFGLLQQEL